MVGWFNANMVKDDLTKNIRTRFAPSPTGVPHIGHLRTAAYAYALAKHNGGEFVLRIEDTDQKRYVPEAVDNLKNMLDLFGIKWDEYFVQSERMNEGVYKDAAEKLISEGHAFYCQCAGKNVKIEGYSKELRDPCRDKNLTSGAIKLRIPDGEKISYHDYVLDKDISWESSQVADTTLLKSDGFPTYHLAVVVDDHDMKISHVLRGHDWLPSTPIHLLIYKYLGYKPAEIGHLTDILSPQGGKLSKRKGSTSILEFLAEGYLPEAILNFVILLGWAPKDNRETFTLSEFVRAFNPKGFQKSNPVFHTEKLDWFNGIYVRQKSDAELAKLLKPFVSKTSDVNKLDKLNKLNKLAPLIKDRIVKLSDFSSFAGFFFEKPKVDVSLFGELRYKEHLSKAVANLTNLTNWTNNEIQTSLTSLISSNNWKTGDFFMSFRIALSGSKFTPPITESAEILGKEETLLRLKNALL